MSYSLIVVDVQSFFKAANLKRLRYNVKKEILTAIEDEASIVFVEFLGCGPTVNTLIELTDSYYKTYLVRKMEDDGSQDIYNLIFDNDLPSEHLKMCGVNTDVCVKATAIGLAGLFPDSQIEIIAKACHSSVDHKAGIKEMSLIPNIFINK